ncbi:MAG: hypothetical protein KC466_01725 [Myxococcales bacterium]|nr:hypothetical protein [Myxococcales bacterium]
MKERTLRLQLQLLEEIVDPDLLEVLDIEPTGIPSPILEFLRAGMERMGADPDMTVAAVAPHLIPPGELNEVEVILCSQSAMEFLFEQPDHVLGVHLVSTPDANPFDEEAPHARALRVAIPFDAEVVMGKIRDAVADIDWTVDEADLVHGAMGWLVTLPHEIHHVLWFAGNGSFNSPADLDVMEGEIGHDLFDLTTGYGIRPAVIEGEEIEPEDAEDAVALLEEMVEERGRLMAERVFTGDLSPD